MRRGPTATSFLVAFLAIEYVAAQTTMAANFSAGTNVPNVCVCATAGFCDMAGGGMINDGAGIIQARVFNTGAVTSFNDTISNMTGCMPAPTGIAWRVENQDTCGDGLDNCCPSNGFTCGIRYPPIAGAPRAVAPQAPFGSYPFIVGIFSQGNFIATGVLIDHLHVLTAAHKLRNVPLPLMIRVGAWNVTASREMLERFDIITYTVATHPNFNATNLRNDIALIMLSTKATLGKFPTISNICLPNLNATSFFGQRCWVAGWGQKTAPVTVPLEVDVPIIENRACQRMLRNNGLGANFALDTTSFVCAGGEDGKDACVGDAGSPLACYVGDRFYLLGLVAWGAGCGKANVPAVYVNVPSYLPWIIKTVSELNGIKSSTLMSNSNSNNNAQGIAIEPPAAPRATPLDEDPTAATQPRMTRTTAQTVAPTTTTTTPPPTTTVTTTVAPTTTTRAAAAAVTTTTVPPTTTTTSTTTTAAATTTARMGGAANSTTAAAAATTTARAASNAAVVTVAGAAAAVTTTAPRLSGSVNVTTVRNAVNVATTRGTTVKSGQAFTTRTATVRSGGSTVRSGGSTVRSGAGVRSTVKNGAQTRQTVKSGSARTTRRQTVKAGFTRTTKRA